MSPKALAPMPAEKLNTHPAVISFTERYLVITAVTLAFSSMKPMMDILMSSSNSVLRTRFFRLLIYPLRPLANVVTFSISLGVIRIKSVIKRPRITVREITAEMTQALFLWTLNFFSMCL